MGSKFQFYCYEQTKRRVEGFAHRGGFGVGRKNARRSLFSGIDRKTREGTGVWISTRGSGVDEVAWGNESELPKRVYYRGCPDRLPESYGNKACGSVDAPNVSSSARSMSSRQYQSVSSSDPSCSITCPKRFLHWVGGRKGKKNGCRGLSASCHGSNVRVA